jgi:TRAP-type C4-dicarboxylate transport system permease small subunit
MADQASEGARPTDPVGRLLHDISKALAIFGGLLACAMAVLVTVSVTGRYLFSAPVPGDYDIVAIMSGCAIFAFLPYCQLTRGNVAVDFLTNKAPARIKSILDAVGTALFLAIAVLFTWRLYYGAVDLYEYSEVIAAFNFYRWTTVPFDILCMIVLIAVIAYTLALDIRAARAAGARDAGRGSP